MSNVFSERDYAAQVQAERASAGFIGASALAGKGPGAIEDMARRLADLDRSAVIIENEVRRVLEGIYGDNNCAPEELKVPGAIGEIVSLENRFSVILDLLAKL